MLKALRAANDHVGTRRVLKKTAKSLNLEPRFRVVIHDRMGVGAKYTIGGLARAAGVPTSTVRYYERRELLTPEGRSRGNYRLYGAAALERLRFVRSAQAAGFTLSDITLLLRFRDGDMAPCREVQELITRRLTRVAEQIEQLQSVETMLQRWLGVCRRSERTGKCGVLDGLAGVDSGCCEKPEKRP